MKSMNYISKACTEIVLRSHCHAQLSCHLQLCCCTLFDQHGMRNQHTVKDTSFYPVQIRRDRSFAMLGLVFLPFLRVQQHILPYHMSFSIVPPPSISKVSRISCAFARIASSSVTSSAIAAFFSQSNCLVYRNILLYRFVSSM